MLKIVVCVLFVSLCGVSCYFTLPGRCPENVSGQKDFKLADFYGKWHQVYHYSSDGQKLNNCSVLELVTRPSGIYLNQSRVDRGLFHRYSIGKLDIPPKIEDAAKLDITFTFKNAPRRLKTRKYPFRVLATNYNYYATVYTCENSPLINKHFINIWNPVKLLQENVLVMDPFSNKTEYFNFARIYMDGNLNLDFYVWLLSRRPTLNEVSKTLAVEPLKKIGLDAQNLYRDDTSACTPKYYDDFETEPMTFRYPVPI